MSQPTLNIVLNINDNQSLWSGLLGSFMAIGALIGSALSPLLLKKFSRKNSLIFIDCLGIAGSLLSMIANLASFSIHRFLVGFATGFNSTLVPLYVKETSPVAITGTTGCINGVMIFVGVVVAYLLGLGFSDPATNGDYYWRFVFLFPIITCLMRIFFLKLVFVYESPLYYVMKN